MTIRIFALACLAFLILGCSDEKGERIEDFTERGIGSVVEFIVQEINYHGGDTEIPEGDFDLGGNWRHTKDKDGAQVYIYNTDFELVASFLRTVLGDPDTELGSCGLEITLDDGMGWYSVRDKGVAVQYSDYEDVVHLIILRSRESI